ncbi:uncharacterized protein [Misgurnus anguillicaudatus]|uniref:uncharacterized protein isoform X1 n=2 Tax=Misgurnus anguillicaudatus TaxID=75329 RepID=UPI003CCFD442
MFRPITPLSDKDMEGTDVENMDFILPNAVPNFDDVLDIGLSSQVGRAAGCFNPCGGEEEEDYEVDVYPTLTEAKRQRVFGGEMDSFLPNAVLTCDYVPDNGLSSEVGCAAGGLNPSGGVEEKIPTMLGWRCDDDGMDFVLPSAVLDIVPNNGHLLDRHAGSSHPRGGVKEFTPAFEEANSPKEKCMKKILNSIKKGWNNVMHPCLQNDKVETLIPSESSPQLNADSAIPNLKDDAVLGSSELNTEIKPDKRKAFFGCLWRGKVESMPTPQLKADPAIPDVREVVDPASQSKTYVSPKKQKQKASKSRKFNLQGEKVTVVPTQQPKAISDIPVGMDVPALAGPQSKTKIHPDSRKTLKQRIFGCFRRGKVESMPTSQIEADPAIPDAREVIDQADSQSKIVGLKKNKKKASKSRLFHNPWRKKGKKVKKDADPAIPDAMDGADLASYDGIAAANARLQKIGAILENIGLKGGGNPDPNKATGSKDDKDVRPKAVRNPRHPWIHNPSRFKNLGPKDDKDVRPKAVGNLRHPWIHNPSRFKNLGPKDDKVVRPKAVENPGPKEDGNPTAKEDKNPSPKALENPLPEDDRVVRPKIPNLCLHAFKPPSEKKPANPPVLKDTLESKYVLLENEVLGQGGFGKVFKGISKSDGTPVAIKQFFKLNNKRTLQIPGHRKPLITEVALMLKLRDAPSCPNVIKMYDWFETSYYINLVLEYSLHSVSLWDFIYCYGRLTENTAKHLMRQAVLAVQHCLDNGVVHTDLHPRNFLVEQSTMTLKLIDFGSGHLLTYDGYKSCDFIGAECCTPPEIKRARKFHAMPANVWALGALLFFMVLGTYPVDDFYSWDLMDNKKRLSKEICDLISWCLAKNPSDRLTLKQILDHDWFKTEPDEAELLFYKIRALST